MQQRNRNTLAWPAAPPASTRYRPGSRCPRPQARSPVAPGVRVQSIIGIKDGRHPERGDGVVTLASASWPSGDTHLVEGDHGVHGTPQAALRIKRILLERLTRGEELALDQCPRTTRSTLGRILARHMVTESTTHGPEGSLSSQVSETDVRCVRSRPQPWRRAQPSIGTPSAAAATLPTLRRWIPRQASCPAP